MITRKNAEGILAVLFILGALAVLCKGHSAPEWLAPGTKVSCTQATLAVQDPGHQFLEPLAPTVEEGERVWVAQSSQWRTRVGSVTPEYYVLVTNRHGITLGYILEDFVIPTDQISTDQG